jgi:hypothetical protein
VGQQFDITASSGDARACLVTIGQSAGHLTKNILGKSAMVPSMLFSFSEGCP